MIAPFMEILDFKLNDKYLLLSSLMSDLLQKFTAEQAKKLLGVGVANIYGLITYLPYDLQEIIPLKDVFNQKDSQGKEFLWQGKLLNIDFRKGAKRFLVLDFTGDMSLKCYLFSVASYTLKTLEINQFYQLVLNYNNGFWSILRFAKLQEIQSKPYFLLGSAVSKSYYVPKYNKLSYLPGGFFNLLHKRLKTTDYVLNLKDLVPENSIIPLNINLSLIHKPETKELYQQAMSQWLSLKVFLKLNLVKYLESLKTKVEISAGNLDLELLKKLSSKLPFELSKTQKTTIWDILQEITTKSKA